MMPKQPPAQQTSPAQQKFLVQKFLVVDDHELVLEGTINALKQQYPEALIALARNAQEAQQQLASSQPDLLVMDLSMPEKTGSTVLTGTGIELLRTVMKHYPSLNIVVQSAYTKALVQLKPDINIHEGGFTIADKSLPLREMLAKVDWALQGIVYTPKEMRTGLELKPEWIEMLKLAYDEGLQDRSIAEKMKVSERTVRNYWTQVQDALGVYPDEGKNTRIQTEKRAREEGLIE